MIRTDPQEKDESSLGCGHCSAMPLALRKSLSNGFASGEAAQKPSFCMRTRDSSHSKQSVRELIRGRDSRLQCRNDVAIVESGIEVRKRSWIERFPERAAQSYMCHGEPLEVQAILSVKKLSSRYFDHFFGHEAREHMICVEHKIGGICDTDGSKMESLGPLDHRKRRHRVVTDAQKVGVWSEAT